MHRFGNYFRVLLFILGVALITAAVMLQTHDTQPAPDADNIKPAAQKADVLVARQKIDVGQKLTEDLIDWIELDDTTSQSGIVIRYDKTSTEQPYLGRITVNVIDERQPLLPHFFASEAAISTMAAAVTPGKRAFAISIDTKGTATAGNFILPNDRVDIIRSINSNIGLQSNLILSNIRVLAIGQAMKGDSLSSTGETATVEVDVQEAEILATAQRTGQISLALRHADDTLEAEDRHQSLLVIRSSGEKAP